MASDWRMAIRSVGLEGPAARRLRPPAAHGGAAVVRLGRAEVGDGQPVFVVAEIGINHNGSVDLAKKLIDGAVRARCDAVKFQKRTPELCVPRHQWNVERDTPWGRLRYIDYKRRIELGEKEYAEIDRHCRERDIPWFASCWDEESIEFIERFDPVCYKAASASLTDLPLLRAMKATGRPLIMSTGMSTMTEIEDAIDEVGTDSLLVAHSTSTYPCPPQALNLRMIQTLKRRWPSVPIGYSGHESGLVTTHAAVALGATFVERHITLDPNMWGTDQRASLDIENLVSLVTSLREVERALGDGVKRLDEGELEARSKLRRVRTDVENCVSSSHFRAAQPMASRHL
jgi:N-acetylneuraminate synthase